MRVLCDLQNEQCPTSDARTRLDPQQRSEGVLLWLPFYYEETEAQTLSLTAQGLRHQVAEPGLWPRQPGCSA